MSAPEIRSSLDLRYLGGRRYRLLAPFVYRSALPGVGSIAVPAGAETDFHSVPRLLWWLLPPDDWGESAVIHDHLYRTGLTTRAQADAIHAEALRHCGAPAWRAAIMWLALRAFGWIPWRRYRAGRGL